MRQIDDKRAKMNQVMGTVFKKLRGDRNYTLEDVADEGLSTSTLSNFENGGAKLSASALSIAIALQNINVNHYEFQHACNERDEQKDYLLFGTGITDAYMDMSTTKLRVLLKKLEKKIKIHPDKKKTRLDKIRIEATLHLLDTDYKPKGEDIAFLSGYLSKLTLWSLEDIRLYSQCTSFFELNMLDELTQKMTELMNMNSQLHYTQRDLIQAILNVIDHFIETKSFNKAHYYVNYLKNHDIHEYYLLEKLTLRYDIAKLHYLEMRDEESLNKMNFCKEVMEFCNCPKTELMIEKEIKEVMGKQRKIL